MGISKEAIIERDYLVWEYARCYDIPLVMTLSGGYSQKSARIISESIINVLNKVWSIPKGAQEGKK
jgi:acetoin utilization deacetylase AcuC-like enzyme